MDFSNAETTDEDVARVAKGVLEHGVTGIVPTLVTSSPEVYRAIIPKLRPKPGSTESVAILGAHLEGDTSDVAKHAALLFPPARSS